MEDAAWVLRNRFDLAGRQLIILFTGIGITTSEVSGPKESNMSGELKGTISTYLETMEKFSESAKTFLLHVHTLYQARDEYRKALAASAELRQALDTGDEALRMLMAKLEKAVIAPPDEGLMENNGSEIGAEPANVKVMKAGAGAASSGAAKTFP
jgi:hypothetical protein